MKKIFILLLCLFLVGCSSNKEKEVIEVDKFNEILSNNGFNVEDRTELYKDIDYIVSSTVANLDDIEIQMFKYTNVDDADKVHKNHIENFNYSKSTGAHEVKDKGKNYYRYVLISNNMYMISVRVSDTLIFTKTNVNNKSIVEKVFTELGY